MAHEKTPSTQGTPSRKSRRIGLLLAVGGLLSICALAVGGLIRAADLGLIPGITGRSTASPTQVETKPAETGQASPAQPSPTTDILPTPSPVATSPPQGGGLAGEVVVVQRSLGQDRLFLLDVASGEKSTLPDVPNVKVELSQAPQWSAGGSRLVWMSRYHGKMHIAAMDMAEQEPYQVAAGEAYKSVSSPAWLSDGKALSFWASGSEGSWLVIADGASGEMLERVALPDYRNLFAWNPKNGLLAFVRQSFDLYEVVISSSAETADGPIESGGEEYAPAWSADGEWLAFQSDAGRERGQNEIWIARVDGSGLRQVTHSPAGSWSRAPTWSPDGRWIAFVSSQSGSAGADYGELFAVEVASGKVEQLTDTGGWIYDWRPAWRPR